MLDRYIGKKVRILEHVLLWNDVGIDSVDVVATKGSIGTILSHQEYSVYYIDFCAKRGFGVHPNHLAWVKSEMEAGFRCPVRFEEYVQPSEDDYAYWEKNINHLHASCQIGAINILPTNSFVFIERMT